ncbi:MAG TPA: hypothetical protein ACQGQH_05170 [Xylella sp.]
MSDVPCVALYGPYTISWRLISDEFSAWTAVYQQRQGGDRVSSQAERTVLLV